MKTHNIKKVVVVVASVGFVIFSVSPAGFAATASENHAQVQMTAQPTKSATDVLKTAVQQMPASQKKLTTTMDFVMNSAALHKVVAQTPVVNAPKVTTAAAIVETSKKISEDIQKKIDQLTEEIEGAQKAAEVAKMQAVKQLERSKELASLADLATQQAALFRANAKELTAQATAAKDPKVALALMVRAKQADAQAVALNQKAAMLKLQANDSQRAALDAMAQAVKYTDLASSKKNELSALLKSLRGN